MMFLLSSTKLVKLISRRNRNCLSVVRRMISRMAYGDVKPTCIADINLIDDGYYPKAAVATDVSLCSDMGKFILEQGGSAVDAAITSLLCLSVVDPQSSSLGGGMSMVVYMDKKAEALNALEMVPLAAHPYAFGVDDVVGAKSITVPRQLVGIWEAHQRFGRLDWKTLFEPAIEIARNGYPVSWHLSMVLHRHMETHAPEIADMFRDENGKLPQEGDILTSMKYADTLEKIANYGPWEFYTGGVGKALLKDIQDQGGILAEDDFCPYKVKASWEPVETTTLKDDITVFSSPMPGGGLLLNCLLNIMNEYNVSDETFLDDKSKLLFYHNFMEAIKLTNGMRLMLGDDHENDSVQKIISTVRSKQFASESRNRIQDDYFTFQERNKFLQHAFPTETRAETSHISITAENGDAVSVTASIGHYFGSRIYSKNTGIFLNNHLSNFYYPGFEDHPNSIKPGRSVFTGTAPAILVDDTGTVKMVVGSAGGQFIAPVNAWVIMRTLWTGATLQQAIDEKRIYTDYKGDLIESGGFDPDGDIENICNALVEMGHTITLDSLRFAVVQAVLRDGLGGLTAYCDKRKGGAPAGY